MSCLYSVTSPSGKSYIGISSKDSIARWKKHIEHSLGNRPGALYSAVRKYGVDQFIVKTLVVVDDWDYLCDLEKRAISAFNTFSPNGYNLTMGGEGTVGPRDEEFRAKVSVAQKKRFENPDQRLKATEYLLQGRSKIDRIKQAEAMRKPEMRKRLSDKAKIQFLDPEQRKRVSDQTKVMWDQPGFRELASLKMKNIMKDPNRRAATSVATREGMRKPETVAKLKEAAARRSADPLWRGKISASKTGKKVAPASQQRKDRISAARHREWSDPIIRERRLALSKETRAKRLKDNYKPLPIDFFEGFRDDDS